MKILFAPSNIASMPSITANALHKLQGVEAKYITTSRHKYLSENNEVAIFVLPFITSRTFRQNPLLYILHNIELRTLHKLRLLYSFYKWIKWCDVVHWTWGSVFPFSLDIRIAKWLKKKRFIEWVGSDIRIPEITMKESKWYAYAYEHGYEYKKIENKQKSYKVQALFAKLGYVPILVPEMQLFLKPGLFPVVHKTQYRYFEKEKYEAPLFQKKTGNKIVIVHSPSAKIAKGSNFIIEVVEALQKKYDIEFVLLHNVPRSDVLKEMERCDIFIDQIILGSYAAAAIEAMSYGKPTLAYIMPSVYKMGTPNDCPIVNTNPDNLEAKLIELIERPELRVEIGMKSRKYVEMVHNTEILSHDLLEIYKNESFG